MKNVNLLALLNKNGQYLFKIEGSLIIFVRGESECEDNKVRTLHSVPLRHDEYLILHCPVLVPADKDSDHHQLQAPLHTGKPSVRKSEKFIFFNNA